MTERKNDMDSDAGVHINWFRFNIPSLVAVGGAAVSIAWYVSTLDGRLANVEQERVQRSVATDRRFDTIDAALAPLTNMPYRVNILEQQATAINLRIDRFTEIITNTMELLRKDVNTLGTKVEVLGEKIDNLTPEKRTDLLGPRG